MSSLLRLFLVCVFGLFTYSLSAQILNIDREGIDDTTSHKWSLNGSLSLSSDKQRNNLVDIGSNMELGRYFKNKYVLIGQSRTDLLFAGKNTIQNQGQFHLRYRDNDTRKLSIELFLQDQWNGAWGMEYRFLQGVNLRIKLHDKAGSDLYTAVGLFHEQERWNWSGVKTTVPPNATDKRINKIRLNNYVKYAKKLSEILDISLLAYLQFPIQGVFIKPRWYQETNLYIHANKHLNFLIHWDHIYDEQRLVPIENFYYSFSTGLQFKL